MRGANGGGEATVEGGAAGVDGADGLDVEGVPAGGGEAVLRGRGRTGWGRRLKQGLQCRPPHSLTVGGSSCSTTATLKLSLVLSSILPDPWLAAATAGAPPSVVFPLVLGVWWWRQQVRRMDSSLYSTRRRCDDGGLGQLVELFSARGKEEMERVGRQGEGGLYSTVAGRRSSGQGERGLSAEEGGEGLGVSIF